MEVISHTFGTEAWTFRNVGLNPNLVRSLLSIFTASPDEFDNMMSVFRNMFHLLPRSHPARPFGLYLFGFGLLQCHESSHQSEDLDQAILHLTEAILLPHPLG